jgi:hypothetical protein
MGNGERMSGGVEVRFSAMKTKGMLVLPLCLEQQVRWDGLALYLYLYVDIVFGTRSQLRSLAYKLNHSTRWRLLNVAIDAPSPESSPSILLQSTSVWYLKSLSLHPKLRQFTCHTPGPNPGSTVFILDSFLRNTHALSLHIRSPLHNAHDIVPL